MGFVKTGYSSQVIKWPTYYSGCSDFLRVLKPEIAKIGTLNKNGDPLGTQKLKKVPMVAHAGAVLLAVHFHSGPKSKYCNRFGKGVKN